MSTTVRTLPWFETLTDSVYALGEAAREYQHAHRAAVLAKENVQLERRQLHDGKATRRAEHVPVGSYRYGQDYSPHHAAVFSLGDRYSRLEMQLHQEYEHAAVLYASGAAWAIASVQGGGTPALVLFTADDHGVCTPHRLEIEGLTEQRYAGARQLAAAYEALNVRLAAAGYGEDLAEQDHLAEHEVGALHEAMDTAMGIADAAYAYGLLAERAVHFALLEPKHEHARQRAAERAGLETPTT